MIGKWPGKESFMIEITNFRQGAVLNHNHGKETDKSLTVRVEGISEMGCPVTVNGVPAAMRGRNFSAEVELTDKINAVTAAAITPYGNFSQELTLVWDKKSFRRYGFYLDDHIFVFTDLAKDRPRSAFDHFYLKRLKEIHDKYGFKLTLNCFFHNAHHEFLLKDMPDTWKSEFRDNADWLRFAFHAYSEFPDRPYCEASGEEFGRDWNMVQNEIVRFAGSECYTPPMVIHWANIHPAVAQEMIRRGVRCYSHDLHPRIMGGPSLADRQKGGDMKEVEKRSVSGADKATGSLGMMLHYGFYENKSFLDSDRLYYDPLIGLFFFNNVACCNLTPLDELNARCRNAAEQAGKTGLEFLALGGHEQYSFPYYPNYQPDHMDRLECVARCMKEGGFEAVFANEGLLGNTAWGK